MSYPEIRIKYAWLLANNASEGLNELWGDGMPLRSFEEYEKRAEEYETAWKPYEKKIIEGMCELLDLEFRQNIIDVNIAPWFRAFSDPMVIGVKYTHERFVEILTHELIHRLLTDNLQSDYHTPYRARWEKLFGDDHSFGTLVHIPVHAVYQALFDDVVKEPAKTDNDKRLMAQYEDYRNAWKYVNERGYREIIEALRRDYEELDEQLQRI